MGGVGGGGGEFRKLEDRSKEEVKAISPVNEVEDEVFRREEENQLGRIMDSQCPPVCLDSSFQFFFIQPKGVFHLGSGYNFKALSHTPTYMNPPISQFLHINSYGNIRGQDKLIC